ncbi:hypothetical protein GDO78_019940 [Eleutherodactylus coqui]|uniref:Uncharacterized protein n=1 Tax=Eleutherodactylus coqui TaxID=57060 RepID=A0A8J6AZ00_ELECQ|nr:hypothetical protein GDO78_019940 [Eleutherodactylus coqui]
MELFAPCFAPYEREQNDNAQNQFVRHHQILVDGLNTSQVKDCWICTHAPVTPTSLPFLAVPVPPEELLAWTNETKAVSTAKETRDSW